MARKRNHPKEQKAPEQRTIPTDQVQRMADWEIFFSRQRNPLLRSQLITSLMAGKPFEVHRLHTATLLDAVVLSMAARNYHEAEIVDDYSELLRRCQEVWSDPLYSCRVMDQMHCCAASFILLGSTEFVASEDLYVPDYVGKLLQEEAPEYFVKEL